MKYEIINKESFDKGYNKAIDYIISKLEDERDTLYMWEEDEYENGLRAGYQYSIEIAEHLRSEIE